MCFQIGSLSLGSIPGSIWATLEDDLVDQCKPGDDVTILGEVRRRWGPLGRGLDGRTDIELALKVNSLAINNNQKSTSLLSEDDIKEFQDFWKEYRSNELEGRDFILASFCPQIYGLYAIKLAMAIVLCGGVEREDSNGTRVRGEAHLLLVGDPGTGKSQLLRYAAKLSPRAVMTTGIGSTNAGLTVAAVKDGGEWHLEAGALVLADGGLCAIDEFNSIREGDRTSIHEAMEQQSISVAKAGLVCKLQTRCSVLAGINPKGYHYDQDEPLTVNTGIASPLLSRFDLVFVLLDSRNEEWDRLVSSHLLSGEDPGRKLSSDPTKRWPFRKLRAYFAYCKNFHPALTEDASRILTRFYQNQRRSDSMTMARTTVRLLQSAIRLAQGHARFMCKDEVSVSDAIFAVILLESSTESTQSTLFNGNPLHTTFPENPEREYLNQAEKVLKALHLEDIWKRLARQRAANPQAGGAHWTRGPECTLTTSHIFSAHPSQRGTQIFPEAATQIPTVQLAKRARLASPVRTSQALPDIRAKPKRPRKTPESTNASKFSLFETENEDDFLSSPPKRSPPTNTMQSEDLKPELHLTPPRSQRNGATGSTASSRLDFSPEDNTLYTSALNFVLSDDSNDESVVGEASTTPGKPFIPQLSDSTKKKLHKFKVSDSQE